MANHYKENDHNQTNNKTKKKKKKPLLERIIIGFSVTVISLCVLSLGAVAVLNMKPLQGEGESFSQPQTESQGSPIKRDSINILLCGIDYSETDTERNGQKLTDLIMVANFDLKANKINILQIPRDTYIGTVKTNRATSYDKINSIYNSTDQEAVVKKGEQRPKMGVNGLAKVINDQYKLPIDYYVTITMENFKDLIDSIGGVDINVPNRIVFSPKFNWVIEPGQQTLNGKQAEWFVRYRKGYDTGDIGRVQAQRLFMASFMTKLMNLSKMQMLALVPKATSYITSNLTSGEMLTLATEVKQLKMENMAFYLIPGEGVTRGVSLYTVHKDSLAELLNTRFRPYSNPVTADELNCIELQNTYQSFEGNGGTFADIYGNSEFNPGFSSSQSVDDTLSN